MTPTKSLLLLPLLLAPLVALADEVTCESIDGRRNECPMDTRGEVRIVRQLSRTACEDGVTWGLSRHAVWVEDGCRAVFASSRVSGPYDGASSYGAASQGGGAPDRVTCESVNGRRTECDMNTRGFVRVQRQLSKTACQEDVSWGLNKHSVWVDGGCRAVFVRSDR